MNSKITRNWFTVYNEATEFALDTIQHEYSLSHKSSFLAITKAQNGINVNITLITIYTPRNVDIVQYSQQIVTKTPHFGTRSRATKATLEQVVKNHTETHGDQGTRKDTSRDRHALIYDAILHNFYCLSTRLQPSQLLYFHSRVYKQHEWICIRVHKARDLICRPWPITLRYFLSTQAFLLGSWYFKQKPWNLKDQRSSAHFYLYQ